MLFGRAALSSFQDRAIRKTDPKRQIRRLNLGSNRSCIRTLTIVLSYLMSRHTNGHL
jgi:hypothetical protein